MITGESERQWLRAQLGDGGGGGLGQMLQPLPYLAAEGGGHSWPFIPAGEGSTTSVPQLAEVCLPTTGSLGLDAVCFEGAGTLEPAGLGLKSNSNSAHFLAV